MGIFGIFPKEDREFVTFKTGIPGGLAWDFRAESASNYSTQQRRPVNVQLRSANIR